MTSERSTKRAYDATRRRERAEEERQETRRRVLAAATELFSERGYTAATIGDIAGRAGVAVQSVYSSVGGKPDLVQAVMDGAITGDQPSLQASHDARLAEIGAAPTPEQRLRVLAATMSRIIEETAAVQRAYREAAAVEPTVAASLLTSKNERRASIELALRTLPEAGLRGGYAEMAITTWSIASFDVYLLQTEIEGRTPADVRAWLAETLVAAVLTAEARDA